MNRPQLGVSTMSPPIPLKTKPIVEEFSCVPLPVSSSSVRPHRLRLHMFYPHSNESVILSGTLLLDQYTRSKSAPIQCQHAGIQIPQVSDDCIRHCEFCLEVFSSNESLLMHLVKYHPERLPRKDD